MLTFTGNGRLTRDIGLRSIRSGKSVATVSVASDRRDREADPVYVDLLLWGGPGRGGRRAPGHGPGGRVHRPLRAAPVRDECGRAARRDRGPERPRVRPEAARRRPGAGRLPARRRGRGHPVLKPSRGRPSQGGPDPAAVTQNAMPPDAHPHRPQAATVLGPAIGYAACGWLGAAVACVHRTRRCPTPAGPTTTARRACWATSRMYSRSSWLR